MKQLIEWCSNNLLGSVTIFFVCGLLVANRFSLSLDLSLTLALGFALLTTMAYMSPLIYCLFARSLHYADKIILEISNICLRLFSQHALISNENPSKSTDSYVGRISVAGFFFVLLFFFNLGIHQGTLSTTPPRNPEHIFHHIQEKQEAIILGRVAAMPAFDGTTSHVMIQLTALRFPQAAEFASARGKIQIHMRHPWPQTYNPGTLLAIRAELQRPTTFRTPGTFDYPAYLARKDIWVTGSVRSPAFLSPVESEFSMMQQLRYLPERLRTRTGQFIDASVPLPLSSLYRAVLLGDRSNISSEVIEGFKASGTMHILAISGVHMSLIATLVFTSLYWLLRRSEYLILRWNLKKAAGILCLPPLLCYAMLAGLNTPVLRSFLMSGIVILALCSDRKKSASAILSCAALLILLANPQSLFTASFQLSFMAVASIAFFIPQLQKRLRPDSRPEISRCKQIGTIAGNWLLAGLIVSLAAIAGTAPIGIYYFNRLSLLGPPANLLLEPLICLWALVLGFLALPFSFVLPGFGTDLLQLGALGLDLAIRITDFASSLPHTNLWFATPPLWLIFCYYLALSNLAIHWRRHSTPRFFGCAMYIIVLIPFFYPLSELTNTLRTDLTATFIDVGQGSATLLEFPGGRRVLIDGGGSSFSQESVGSRVIAPFLWSKGITTLDSIIITHPDADHYNGIPFLVEHFSPTLLWTSTQKSDDEQYDRLLALARKSGTRVIMPKSGEVLEFGKSRIRCVANFSAQKHLGARSNNNSGLVIRVAAPTFTLLFPGDIESQLELQLIRQSRSLQSDILLSPHHGSKTSNSPYFLATVNPQYLIVSAGKTRPAHFPGPKLVAHCRQQGLPLLTTAAHGTITVTGSDRGMEISGLPDRRDNPLRQYSHKVSLSQSNEAVSEEMRHEHHTSVKSAGGLRRYLTNRAFSTEFE